VHRLTALVLALVPLNLVLADEGQPPPPRLKPIEPVLVARAYSGGELGAELLDGRETPILVHGAVPHRWLAVGVWVALLPAGEPVRETVTLKVTQGKAKTVQKMALRGLDGDTELVPFFVPVGEGCEPMVITATVGKRTTTRTLALSCE